LPTVVTDGTPVELYFLEVSVVAFAVELVSVGYFAVELVVEYFSVELVVGYFVVELDSGVEYEVFVEDVEDLVSPQTK